MNRRIGPVIGSPKELLAQLPGPCTERWPDGERFIEIFKRGDFSAEIYAPVKIDSQKPHDRDEIYFVISGNGEFVVDGERSTFAPGDALFVAAHTQHRFENFSNDFATWVVFFGPKVAS